MSDSRWQVSLSDVVVDDVLVDSAAEAVRSGWWSMGPRVADLEDRFAAFTGSKHAIAVANGTAALHLALLAADVGPGDEVITPSLTFVAAANATRLVGATPVFCDIVGDHDLNLDPEDLEAAIGPRTKAIVVLHYGGFPCDLAAVTEIAERHGIVVIEDAAHAIGSAIGERQAGSIGALGCFSFFANKNLPIGEGGMVVTDDDALAARVRLLRSHGMTTLTWDRHRGHASAYDVVEVGFNYRLDEVRAALATVQLGRVRAANTERARISDAYRERIHGSAGLEMPFADRSDRESSSHHLAVVLVPGSADRDAVRSSLQDSRIQTSMHYPPIHRFTAYAGLANRPLARTEAVASRLITLPLYPTLRDDQIELVAESLIDAVGSAPARVSHASAERTQLQAADGRQ